MCYPDFMKLFEPGRVFETDEFGRVTVSLQPAGFLLMPVGRAVIVESAEGFEGPITAYPFLPGRHPVLLSIANFEDGRQWVAAALMASGTRLPVEWEALVQPGENDDVDGEGPIQGFGATRIVVTFMDEEAYTRIATEPATAEQFVVRVADEATERLVNDWSWSNATLDTTTGLNVVSVATGLCDGLRSPYVGLDEHGDTVALLVDFAIFDYELLV